jgi:hypothetical protein
MTYTDSRFNGFVCEQKLLKQLGAFTRCATGLKTGANEKTALLSAAAGNRHYTRS